MSPRKETKHSGVDRLKTWITQNKKVDLTTFSIKDINSNKSLNWKGLDNQKDEIVRLLKAYQRLLNILPKDNQKLILKLLQANIQSAIQVASTPKQNFINHYGDLFNNSDITTEDFYNNALVIKTRLLLKHVQKIS